MEKQAFTIELDVNDIDRIAELTDILVETAEDFEVAVRMLLYELS